MTVDEGEGSGFHSYPPPLATYQDVVTFPHLFIDTLKKLHLSMGTKFMIPIVGGRDLDLHRLFVEVTSRGGIAKVVNDKKWKEVTGVFNFPSSATNASFIIRKYYISLIYHYEQIYFFNAKCWSPSPLVLQQTGGGLQNLSTIVKTPPPKSQTTPPQVSSSGTDSPTVCGVIDGKFESGYLISVKIGCEELKGVLYQPPYNSIGSPSNITGVVGRRKRRKKSEMRKRDPGHPKPNRSGYNFFFAEQHARLKPHYHGRDREISRIIGESWNKLQQPQRIVYEEKAVEDKQRYKTEMEVYRERLRTPLNNNNNFTMPDLNNNNSSSSNVNEMMIMMSKESEECCQLKNVNIQIMAADDEAAFDLQTSRIDDGDDDEQRNMSMDQNHGGAVLVEHGILPSNVVADESLPSLL